MALPTEIAIDTVTRVRATTTTDSHGNEIRSWATATTSDIVGCSMQPEDGSEIILGREEVVSRWQLFLPPNADLLPSDRVRFEGITYEVDGSVQKWPDIGGLGHKSCLLKLVEG